MRAFEWKWGLGIGGAWFASLVATWALGWHGGGLGLIQVSGLLPILPVFAGYLLALRTLLRREPETGFGEGVKAGALVAVVAATVAAGGQAVYLRWINPGWTGHVVEEVTKHYAGRGLDEAALAEIAEGARTTFGFANSVIQAGVGTLLLGILCSAGIVGVLRWLANR